MPFWVQPCKSDSSERTANSSVGEQELQIGRCNAEVDEESTCEHSPSSNKPLPEDIGRQVHYCEQRVHLRDDRLYGQLDDEPVGDTEHRIVGQEHLARSDTTLDKDKWLGRVGFIPHDCGDEWLDGVGSVAHGCCCSRIDSKRGAGSAGGDHRIVAVTELVAQSERQERGACIRTTSYAVQTGVTEAINDSNRRVQYVYNVDQDKGVYSQSGPSIATRKGLSSIIGSILGGPAPKRATGATLLRAQWYGQPRLGVAGGFVHSEHQYQSDHAEEANTHQGQSAIHLDGGVDAEPPKPQRPAIRTSTVKVADRVRNLELKQVQSRQTLRKSTAGDGPPELLGKSGDGNVPLVFPLHVKRFVRRQRNGSPLRPETPLYQSDPDQNSIIHSPLPQRTIPQIKTPKTPVASSSPGMLAVEKSREGWSEDKALAVSRIRPSPFMHLHGTRGHCVRHGRKLGQSRAEFQGTKEMFEKGRSGAYIPTGLLVRRQMDATSPWRFTAGHKLTKTADIQPKSESDACPDCITELGIQKNEISQATISTIRQKIKQQPPTAAPIPQETVVVQPPFKISATPQPRAATKPPVVPVTRIPGEQPVVLHAQGLSEGSDAGDLVTAADLGDGLDAVILERGGRLERVIMNARKGPPNAEAMEKLSKELILVSNAIAAANLNPSHSQVDGASPVGNDRAMVVDTRHGRQQSMPELLSMIDEAAGGLNLGIARARGDVQSTDSELLTTRDDVRERSQSLLTTDAVSIVHEVSSGSALSPESRIANRQRLDQDIAAVRSHIGPFAAGQRNDAPAGNALPCRTVHWPVPGAPTLHINSPPPLKRSDSDLARVASPDLPIKIQIDSSTSTPTLTPDATLTRHDPIPPPTSPLLSPALFTPSTCASTPEASPILLKPDTPYPQVATTSRLQAPSSVTGIWPTLPSQARADTQVIRAAMRMEKNKTAQEAAATERAVRKQRQVSAQARKALS
ncbi:unnamed protein product [Zymoseptoria tritici ST99CH_3D7]|uniref:Uncharacterized protein n=2 Tax=Zymoseptoria tritici TaxID=1047171 RepID=A0A1X7RS52_ZYMT9|nr:unnamed protein product [Zymoseptoria tritici ST99CH_3D7]SMR51040.1 unnamed protein product [Zymoseptoria tritici ST99CH_1E4]